MFLRLDNSIFNAYEEYWCTYKTDCYLLTQSSKVKCGLFVNQEYPWLRATSDFVCSCGCRGKGCGEIRCPLCLENSDFNSCVLKPSSCLKKNSAGEFILLSTHEYY